MTEHEREIVYFVQISDTHIGPTAGYTRHGHQALPCARHMVDVINNSPVRPDFVIHTGDVVTDPDPDAYRLAAETFARLEVPIYYVVGNHDWARDIHRFLPMGPKEDFGEDSGQLSYLFEVKGQQFVVLDGRGPDEIDPHGLFSEEQVALVRRLATPEGPRLTLFTHYPLLPINSIWMDANMLAINGAQIHEALLPARKRLHGVFHGHTHRSMQIIRDGILYVSAPSTFAQFYAWPNDLNVQFDEAAPPGYNFVHLLPEQTIIHQQTISRP